jgi:hypothetical protein
MYTIRVNAGPKERMEKKENPPRKTQAIYQGRHINIKTRASLPDHARKKEMKGQYKMLCHNLEPQ